MLEILAHRGNVIGPAAATQNTFASIATALSHGWGVEIDIRRSADGRFFLAHDARSDAPGCAADAVCELLRQYPHATVALSISQLGHEADLAEYLAAQRIRRQVFLFDMELIEQVPGSTAALFRRLDADIRIAARVSDRREPLERALSIDVASIIWLDEFDRLWATARDVRRLKNRGRKVYAVSPDLHGYPVEIARQRWLDFMHWDVDGICTDYPGALANTLLRMHAPRPIAV